MTFRSLILAAAILLVGCGPAGPPSTDTTSAKFGTVAERAKFLEQYVSFRRTYETLDFSILYRNNGGGLVPGPSDWNILLVATVPASELPAWIPAGVAASPNPDAAWLKSVPTSLDLSGVQEWYLDGKRAVGLDRAKRIVAYRLSSL